jgi:PIN domain nuclease of toxin-antitoxin system
MELNEWIRNIKEIGDVRFVPVDNGVAIQSLNLPGEFYADPADRIITALARHRSVPLVTADPKFRAYQHVNTVW